MSALGITLVLSVDCCCFVLSVHSTLGHLPPLRGGSSIFFQLLLVLPHIVQILCTVSGLLSCPLLLFELQLVVSVSGQLGLHLSFLIAGTEMRDSSEIVNFTESVELVLLLLHCLGLFIIVECGVLVDGAVLLAHEDALTSVHS